MTKLPAAAIVLCFSAFAANEPALWRDPGPIGSLDLAGGPGGARNAPKPPFRFESEETEGINPKVVVSDSTGRKWMVKFGDEAKAETFASRIAWAAGYPVRPSYYLASGRIEGVTSLKRADKFVGADGAFQSARFQKFDDGSFREVKGGRLDLHDRNTNLNHLNGLKLTLLLVANWDVKPANTAVFDVGGQQYATVSDWGASLGDPGSPDAVKRKWNCEGFTARTDNWIDGVENGYLQFNYDQYAARGVNALTSNIRLEDAKWYLSRMRQLSDAQLRAALTASGASPEEASCFAAAIRKRLQLLQAAVDTGGEPQTIRTRTVTTTTTTTTVQPDPAPEKK